MVDIIEINRYFRYFVISIIMYQYQTKIRSYIDMILATPSMQISCKIATQQKIYGFESNPISICY